MIKFLNANNKMNLKLINLFVKALDKKIVVLENI